MYIYIMKAYIDVQHIQMSRPTQEISPLSGLLHPTWESCSFFFVIPPHPISYYSLQGFCTFLPHVSLILRSNLTMIAFSLKWLVHLVVQWWFPLHAICIHFLALILSRFPYLQVPLIPQLPPCIILLPLPFINLIAIPATYYQHLYHTMPISSQTLKPYNFTIHFHKQRFYFLYYPQHFQQVTTAPTVSELNSVQ